MSLTEMMDEGYIPDKQQTTFHQYIHRLYRIYDYLNGLAIDDESLRSEFILRSALMNAILNFTFRNAVEIEAGCVSFAPIYSKKFKMKEISDLFGNNVVKVLKGVAKIKTLFDNGGELTVKKSNWHSKNIYSCHMYIDLYMLYNLDLEKEQKILVDRDFIEVKDGQIFAEGETSSWAKYCSYYLNLIKWKEGHIEHTCGEMQLAIGDIRKKFKQRKGIILDEIDFS